LPREARRRRERDDGTLFGELAGTAVEFWPCLMCHALLLIVAPALALAWIIPWAVLVAFAPAWRRAAAGLAREEGRLDIRRLDWSEAVFSAACVLIWMAAFCFTPPPG